jgi:thiosulfate dehydrogenase (quinone) large subunit
MQLPFFRRFHTIFPRNLVSRLGLSRPEAAWLVPARVFIAIGWLRACLEKIADPQWSSGETLRVFLETQQSQIALPFYQYLVNHLFMVHLKEVAFIVLLGQWLVGLGILFGGWTQVALGAGIIMNLNFLLMGKPDPSAFYIVIQWMLLVGRAERVMSLDAFLRRYNQVDISNTTYLVITVVLGVLTALLVPLVNSFTPSQIVKDPVAVLIVILVFIGLSTAFLAVQNSKAIKEKALTTIKTVFETIF